MTRSFIGIDPGFTGAIALFDSNCIKVWSMPIKKWDGRTEIDLAGLRQILTEDSFRQPNVAGLEWNSIRPGNDPQAGLRFGVEMGQLEAAFYMLKCPVIRVAPNRWKKFLGLPGKVADPHSIQAAAMWERLYPEHAGLIRGPRGGLLDGNLDALLIAEYLRQTEASVLGTRGGKRPPVFEGLTADEMQGKI